MIKKIVFLGFVVASFFFGAYVWKLVDQYAVVDETAPESDRQTDFSKTNIIVKVGEAEVTKEDLEVAIAVHLSNLEGQIHLSKDEIKLAEALEFKKKQQIEKKGSENLRERLLEEVIERTLLLQYINRDPSFRPKDFYEKSNCIDQSKDMAEKFPKVFFGIQRKKALENRLCQQATIEGYFQEMIAEKIQVTPEEIAVYYDRHKEEFNFPDRYSIRQIVVSEERKARWVRHRLRKHNFASMAKEHSIAPEGSKGGLISNFELQSMPQIFHVVEKMKIGQISEILKSTYGFHIIMLVGKKKASQRKLVEVSDQIRRSIFETYKKREYRKWVDLALHTVSVGLPSRQ